MDDQIEENSSAAPETSDIPPGPAGQVEIPFVPAHKRQALANPDNRELKDDTIVFVGRANTRRKQRGDKARIALTSRSKSEPQSSGTGAPSATHDDREIEEFDYSSVPNFLDSESKHGNARGMHEESERKKKKQRHDGKGMPMSSSDRPPKM